MGTVFFEILLAPTSMLHAFFLFSVEVGSDLECGIRQNSEHEIVDAG